MRFYEFNRKSKSLKTISVDLDKVIAVTIGTPTQTYLWVAGNYDFSFMVELPYANVMALLDSDDINISIIHPAVTDKTGLVLQCNSCKEQFIWRYQDKLFNYCPYCGGKVRHPVHEE